jgi:acyl-CoA thioesterase
VELFKKLSAMFLSAFRTVGPVSLRRSLFSSFAPISNFDLDTSLEKIKDFHYRGKVTDNFSVGDAPNGGYLMMMAIKAVKDSIGVQHHPDPLSVTAYYVSKAFENHPVDISVRIISNSRSSTTVSVAMSQDGGTKSEYMAVFGNLSKTKGFSFNRKTALTLPPRNECVDATKILRKYGNHVKLFRELEVFIPSNDPFISGLFKGKPGSEALLRTWVKLADGRNPCLSSLAFYADALPPPVLNLKPSNWVPTLEYTVHFWSHPPVSSSEEDSWLQGKFETVYSNNGMLYTDAEIWSHDGKSLLATARQLAKVLEPRPDGK